MFVFTKPTSVREPSKPKPVAKFAGAAVNPGGKKEQDGPATALPVPLFGLVVVQFMGPSQRIGRYKCPRE